jgi:hypothetical protein
VEIISHIERVEIKFVGWERSPETKSKGVECGISRNWIVISSSHNILSILPNDNFFSISDYFSGISIKFNSVLDIYSLNLPWISFC